MVETERAGRDLLELLRQVGDAESLVVVSNRLGPAAEQVPELDGRGIPRVSAHARLAAAAVNRFGVVREP
jgi:hypothetical protein